MYRNVSILTTQLREINLGLRAFVNEEWRECIGFSSFMGLGFAVFL